MIRAIVLDSSAILALLQDEPGAAEVEDAISDEDARLYISSVNLSEVAAKLLRDSSTTNLQLQQILKPFLPYTVDCDTQQAMRTAELSKWTRHLGLSLGDRACLALAAFQSATAWTTDAVWAKFKKDIKIHQIR